MKVQRRIGPGDREFVRGKVLAIAFVSPENIIDQLRMGILAATDVGMILRAHYRADRLTAAERYDIMSLYQRNPEQKMREHSFQEFSVFQSTAKAFEIVVSNAEIGALRPAINECWNTNRQRFLNGNFAKLSHEELIELHPQFNWDLAEAYHEFVK